MSGFFTASNGTQQGGILSPFLFCCYISDLLTELHSMALVVTLVEFLLPVIF